jgi:hypothetical protein
MNATMTLTPEAREDLLCYLVTTVAAAQPHARLAS